MTEEPQKNEIDFDELDKAVNSLMGKVGNETITDDAEVTKTLDITTTLKPDESPSYDALERAAKKIGGETLATDREVELHYGDLTQLPDKMDLQPTAVTTIAESPVASVVFSSSPLQQTVKRPTSGRFMDMVHPKADMRGTASSAPTIAVPSRSVITEPVPVAVPLQSVMPADKEAQSVPEVALITPFLPGAKVEKRPLGSGSPFGATGISNEEAEQTASAEAHDVDSEQVVETGSINSEESKKTDDGSGDEQRALNAADFVKETLADQVLSKIESTEATIVAPPPADGPALQDQINGPRNDGAIYDVQQYHQPLNHPVKQRSGWGVVVVIVIIIILSIALAGGAYVAFVLRG